MFLYGIAPKSASSFELKQIPDATGNYRSENNKTCFIRSKSYKVHVGIGSVFRYFFTKKTKRECVPFFVIRLIVRFGTKQL